MEMIQNLQQFFLLEVYLYFRMFRSCNISGPIPTDISNMTELQILQFPYHLSSSFSLLFIYLFSFCLFYWKRSELQPTYDWREHGQLSPYYLLQIHAYESSNLLIYPKKMFNFFCSITSCQYIEVYRFQFSIILLFSRIQCA